MKRCPQCSFLYLDTDEVCDLDGTPLSQVNDAEVEEASAPRSRSRGRGLVLTAIAGLIVGVAIVFGYLTMSRRNAPEVQTTQPIAQGATPSPSQPVTVEIAVPTPATSPSQSPVERSSPSPTPRSARVGVNTNPVSTGANESADGPVVIRLSNGSRIEADEAWRTKEGVWYRRSGVVTLLSANHVKSIERGGHKRAL